MAFRNLDERIRPIAAFVGEDERADARDVGLKSEHQQVGEQADVLLVIVRNAGGLGHVGPRRLRQAGGALDALLDVADRHHVFVQLAAVVLAQTRLERRGVFTDEIEYAAAIAIAASSFGIGPRRE